jgi:hypothetical protein
MDTFQHGYIFDVSCIVNVSFLKSSKKRGEKNDLFRVSFSKKTQFDDKN